MVTLAFSISGKCLSDLPLKSSSEEDSTPYLDNPMLNYMYKQTVLSLPFNLISPAAVQHAGSCYVSAGCGEQFISRHSAATNYTSEDCYHISHQSLPPQTAKFQFFHYFPTGDVF